MSTSHTFSWVGACALALAMTLAQAACSDAKPPNGGDPDDAGVVFPSDAGDGGDAENGDDAGNGDGLTVDLGPDRRVEAGARVVLDGTRSRSANASIVSWAWQQTAGPAVVLTDADTGRPSFEAPTVGPAGAALVFELAVTDSARRAGSATTRVEVIPYTGIVETTAHGKIRRALHEGTLDRDTAAQYLAFSIYGDPRLPEAYRGTSSGSATSTRRMLSEEYPTLSAAAKAVVRPFMLPPGSPDSYISQQLNKHNAVPVTWEHVMREHVAIWYLSDLPGGEDLAEKVADEAEKKIWPRLEEVWGADHMPILWKDRQSPTFTGVDGKLNVYFARGLRAYGSEDYYHTPPSPTFIELRETLDFSGKNPAGMIESLAHEMTHSCQDSYRQAELYSNARWVFEGIAVWAEDDVYRRTDSEHEYAKEVMSTLHLPLDTDVGERPYGTYLFFQYVTRAVEDEFFVRRVFEQFQAKPALAAVESAFAGVYDLADTWGDFLEAAWNRGPDGWFRKRDRLEEEAAAEGGAEPEEPAQAGPTGSTSISGTLPHLAARYRHFKLNDSRHRWITIWDGLRHALKIHTDSYSGDQEYVTAEIGEEARRGAVLRVLALKDGEWTSPWLYSNPRMLACRDQKEERFDELVVILGNGVAEKDHQLAPAELDPVLWVSNAGCFSWHGESTAVSRQLVDSTVTSRTIWQRSQVAPHVMKLRHSEGTWKVSGQVGSSPPEVCTASGEGSWSTDYGANDSEATELHLDLSIIAGPNYRRLGGSEPGQGMLYTVTCRIGETVTNTYTEHTRLTPFSEEMWCGEEQYPYPVLGDSGDIATGSVECTDGEDRNWSFTSQPEH